MRDVKDLNLKTRWFNNNGDIKVVNNMKDLDLKMFWFEKILICLRRLPRAKKKLIIKSKSDEKEKWLNLKSKTLLLSYVLNSVFDNIIIIALSNRMLNDSKFNKIATWYFVIINLISVVMMIMLLWLLHIVAHPL